MRQRIICHWRTPRCCRWLSVSVSSHLRTISGSLLQFSCYIPGCEDLMDAKTQIDFLESASRCVRYDDAPDLWNRVIALLELGLCYQPAISKVLQQGRW